jgi:hypothetical protein
MQNVNRKNTRRENSIRILMMENTKEKFTGDKVNLLVK